MAKIVETDNFGGDYPNEDFTLGSRSLPWEEAEAIADILNACWGGEDAPRFWKVVEDEYRLVPGFEP
jgi:hypothetical protein